MTGQEQILTLRRGGRSPRVVFVNDFACRADDGMTVSVAQADVPEQQDWRFLVGLTAVVLGDSTDRVHRIAQACGQFARRVIATVTGPAESGPWGLPVHPVVTTTDTEGVFTWPK